MGRTFERSVPECPMGLMIEKLERVKRMGNGAVIARCPACAAGGQDRDGNHLKVYPDGRFSCVVNAGVQGKWHRKRIWEIAGDRKEKREPVKLVYKVRVG